MKALILVLLLVSALFLGCGQQTQEKVSDKAVEQSAQATEENVMAEVEKTTISDSEEVELGEMI